MIFANIFPPGYNTLTVYGSEYSGKCGYHFTYSTLLKSILEKGVLPSKSGLWGPGVYMVTTPTSNTFNVKDCNMIVACALNSDYSTCSQDWIVSPTPVKVVAAAVYPCTTTTSLEVLQVYVNMVLQENVQLC